MTFWRFMGAVGAALFLLGAANHSGPHYYIAVMLICGSIGGFGSLLLFFGRH